MLSFTGMRYPTNSLLTVGADGSKETNDDAAESRQRKKKRRFLIQPHAVSCPFGDWHDHVIPCGVREVRKPVMSQS